MAIGVRLQRRCGRYRFYASIAVRGQRLYVRCYGIIEYDYASEIKNLDLHTPMGYIKDMKKEIKPRAVRRLKLIEGQIRGLQKMVEDDRYCIDIITQASAIKEALSGVEDLLLENHLTTHVIHQVKNGEEDKATKEILKVYKLKRKK